ncbi:MAG: hypothetical protein GXP10_10885 [Gammaproteobacteria bacterium]|nr:hypothetical protein [Gammaproteobacteria bacterium]
MFGYRKATALILLLVLGLSACGGGGSGGISKPAEEADPPPAPNIPNVLPRAVAGDAQTVVSGDEVLLNASGSDDSDGTISRYLWTDVSAVDVNVILRDNGSVLARFTAPSVVTVTQLLFQVRVTDDEGASATDSVVITVLPPQSAVTVSGRVTFDRVPFNALSNLLDYAATRADPARGVVVEAVHAVAAATVISSTVTDANGEYALLVPTNTNLFIRVHARMLRRSVAQSSAQAWDISVEDNTRFGARYVMDGGAASSGEHDSRRMLHASSGWDGSSYAATRVAAPFAILDSIYKAVAKVSAVDGRVRFPPLTINWSENNVPVSGSVAQGQIGTSKFSAGQLYLLGAENVDTDEYDEHVVIHEMGHYLERYFSRFDSIGGPHGLNERLDMRVAFSEGWSSAMAAIATDEPIYRDSVGAAQGLSSVDDVERGPNRNRGWYNDGSVQAILYDLYDSADDGADTLSLGFAPIYRVMSHDIVDSAALVTIFPFIDALKRRRPNAATAIDALVAAQQISAINDAFGSAETNSAGSPDVLPVYTPLTVNGASVNVCSIDKFGVFNKLSNRRFFTFTVEQPASRTIRAMADSGDVKLILYRRGRALMVVDRSEGAGEVMRNAVSAGHLCVGVD